MGWGVALGGKGSDGEQAVVDFWLVVAGELKRTRRERGTEMDYEEGNAQGRSEEEGGGQWACVERTCHCCGQGSSQGARATLAECGLALLAINLVERVSQQVVNGPEQRWLHSGLRTAPPSVNCHFFELRVAWAPSFLDAHASGPGPQHAKAARLAFVR